MNNRYALLPPVLLALVFSAASFPLYSEGLTAEVALSGELGLIIGSFDPDYDNQDRQAYLQWQGRGFPELKLIFDNNVLFDLSWAYVKTGDTWLDDGYLIKRARGGVFSLGGGYRFDLPNLNILGQSSHIDARAFGSLYSMRYVQSGGSFLILSTGLEPEFIQTLALAGNDMILGLGVPMELQFYPGSLLKFQTGLSVSFGVRF